MFRTSISFSSLALLIFSFLLLVVSVPALAQGMASSGTVLETMDASGYTYLHLDTGTEKLWVAIPASQVEKGKKVTFLDGMVMKDFHSKTLDKTFPSIIFSPGLDGMGSKSPHASSAKKKQGSSSFADAVKKETTQKAAPSTPSQISGGSSGAVVPFIETKVEKATGENSYSVEEIFAKAKELDGKKVRVKGKVVKFNPNIMGKNWTHIQDGSGDPMNNTHDLVVTTANQTATDEIIVIEGMVSANKDFGFGYKYDVLIEDAEIIR